MKFEPCACGRTDPRFEVRKGVMRFLCGQCGRGLTPAPVQLELPL